MYFIGSGALLTSAVRYCKAVGLRVDGVCCPPKDYSNLALRNQGLPVIESVDPNKDYASIINDCKDGLIFSINNKHIIKTDILASGVNLFNIHNGLVQRYRGIAEVCIFAALCRGETQYGVTLHQVLPDQNVDAGPVVAQLGFDINPEDTFAIVLKRSLAACQHIFELNVQNIVSHSHQTIAIDVARLALSYKDVQVLGTSATPDRFKRASDLGPYQHFFRSLTL